ncbi:hypothetical protein ABK040_009800 [Willaertia magna]
MSATNLPLMTRDDVAKHNSESDCWVICHQKVYNLTNYLSEHPGGIKLILKDAGKDCTSSFEAMYHSHKARNILEKYLIGILNEKNQNSNEKNIISKFARNNGFSSNFLSPFCNSFPRNVVNPYEKKRENAFKVPVVDNNKLQKAIQPNIEEPILDTEEFKEFKIILIKHVTHDTKVFSMRLPKTKSLNIKPGQHIQIGFTEENGELMVRKFTPTNIEAKGYFELTFKLYKNGKLSQKLDKMKIGDKLFIRGPFGVDNLVERINQHKSLFMCCIGSGITPMFQIINYYSNYYNDLLLKTISNEPKQEVLHKVVLLYGCKTIKDIILEKELNLFSQYLSDCGIELHIYYQLSREFDDTLILSHEEKSRKLNNNLPTLHYSSGKIDDELIKKHLTKDDFCLLCGTETFVENNAKLISQLGIPLHQRHLF